MSSKKRLPYKTDIERKNLGNMLYKRFKEMGSNDPVTAIKVLKTENVLKVYGKSVKEVLNMFEGHQDVTQKLFMNVFNKCLDINPISKKKLINYGETSNQWPGLMGCRGLVDGRDCNTRLNIDALEDQCGKCKGCKKEAASNAAGRKKGAFDKKGGGVKIALNGTGKGKGGKKGGAIGAAIGGAVGAAIGLAQGDDENESYDENDTDDQNDANSTDNDANTTEEDANSTEDDANSTEDDQNEPNDTDLDNSSDDQGDEDGSGEDDSSEDVPDAADDEDNDEFNEYIS